MADDNAQVNNNVEASMEVDNSVEASMQIDDSVEAKVESMSRGSSVSSLSSLSSYSSWSSLSSLSSSKNDQEKGLAKTVESKPYEPPSRVGEKLNGFFFSNETYGKSLRCLQRHSSIALMTAEVSGHS